MRSDKRVASFKVPTFLATASLVLVLSVSTTIVVTVDPATVRVVTTLLFAIILLPALNVVE